MSQHALLILSGIVDTLSSPLVGGVIVALTGLMLGDFATAIATAFRQKGSGLWGTTFEPLLVAEFLRSHVLGRLSPILILVLLASFVPALTPVVALAVTAYTAETLASIRANLGLGSDANAA